jgi:hypothetical protein
MSDAQKKFDRDFQNDYVSIRHEKVSSEYEFGSVIDSRIMSGAMVPYGFSTPGACNLRNAPIDSEGTSEDDQLPARTQRFKVFVG